MSAPRPAHTGGGPVRSRGRQGMPPTFFDAKASARGQSGHELETVLRRLSARVLSSFRSCDFACGAGLPRALDCRGGSGWNRRENVRRAGSPGAGIEPAIDCGSPLRSWYWKVRSPERGSDGDSRSTGVPGRAFLHRVGLAAGRHPRASRCLPRLGLSSFRKRAPRRAPAGEATALSGRPPTLLSAEPGQPAQ